MYISQVKKAIMTLIKEFKNSGAIDTTCSLIEVIEPESMHIIESLKLIYSISDKVRFDFMLRGLSDDPLNVEQKMNELYNFVVDEDRAFFVSDCFRKVLLSKSPIVCCIMGLILADAKNKAISIDQLDAIIMNALVDFTDHDIRNFYEMTDGSYFDSDTDNKRFLKISCFPETERYTYTLTVDLCCQSRIFRKETRCSNGNLEIDAIAYSEIAIKLREYIDRARRQLHYGQNGTNNHIL